MKCHICGAHVSTLPEGVYLQRVNPKGEDGIFECFGTPNKNALLSAIEGAGLPLHASPTQGPESMSDTKVDALLASWPSTMDTPGDADKMQAMVSLARFLQDDLTAAEKERDEARRYAERLARSIWGSRYRTVSPDWKPCDTLIGLLTQLDNMAAGAINDADAAESRLSALQSVVEQKDGVLRLILPLAKGYAHEHNGVGSNSVSAAEDNLRLSPEAAGGVYWLIESTFYAPRRYLCLQGRYGVHEWLTDPNGATRFKSKQEAMRYVMVKDEPCDAYEHMDCAGPPPLSTSPNAAGEQADTTRDAVILPHDFVHRTDPGYHPCVTCGKEPGHAIHRALKSTHPDQSPAKHGEAT